MNEEKITPLPWVLAEPVSEFEDDVVEISTAIRIADNVIPIAKVSIGYAGAVGEEQRANAAYIVHACNLYPELVEALERAQEELRLIRMKDCDAVYDTTLRMDMELVLSRAKSVP